MTAVFRPFWHGRGTPRSAPPFDIWLTPRNHLVKCLDQANDVVDAQPISLKHLAVLAKPDSLAFVTTKECLEGRSPPAPPSPDHSR
jgi:hypothetical protein